MTEQNGYTMTIGGRAVAGDGAPLGIIDPATGMVFAHAPNCSRSQLDAAVAAARMAFPGWSATPLAERRRRVAAIAGVINAHLEDLKELLTREQGKPFEVATGELQGAAYWAASAEGLDLPVERRDDGAGRTVEIRHVPLGVVGAIVPWNYPVLSALMKIVPALVAGNTLVLKPAPTTPLATLRLGELLRGSLPAGVLNIISGDDGLGPWLVEHEGVDKISFTGSTATGRKIMRGAADRIKRVSLELGGNDAAIVLPDVNVPVVAGRLFWGALLNSGQICVAAKRIYVHERIYDAFFAEMVRIGNSVKVGAGQKPGMQMGPIQNKAQYDRLLRMRDTARAEGLSLHSLGSIDEAAGYFFPVTLVDNPPDTAEVVTQEAFGPILPILKFTDVDDVVRRANDSEYGLAGSVWSGDVAAATEIGDRLQCGTVWINTIMDSPPDIPLGGHKQSGLGVENGNHGLLEYTNLQTRIVVRGAEAHMAHATAVIETVI